MRRVLSALIVLAIGGLAAAPFYRPSPQPPLPPASSTAYPPLAPTSDSPPDSQIGSALTPPDASLPPTAASQPAFDPVTFQSGNRRESELQLSPRAPEAETRVPPANSLDPRLSERAPDPTTDQTSEDLNWRSHRIVDGDTLERIARRMLGDPTRWPEIRTANADILSEDGVLPIGKTLRIPPRNTPPASDLVPVPWSK